MDEEECGFLLLSQRECSALGLRLRTAQSKAEAADVLQTHELSRDDIDKDCPYLAKVIRDLPDESPPAP
ncbi:hypothetical protein [Streptomyces achromogenes]|uniref:hypothetical protein n=1 Tax=Streptomyces achromogenes TaxID=67255 RepID=UPI003722E694